MENITTYALYAVVILVALFGVFGFIAGLYKRASKEISFVRTGFGGQKVIMNGGALIMPVLHETIPVNMNTLRLEVKRANEQALITRDRMRVDVQAEFFVRVQPTTESIANAAQTLGRRTMDPEALKDLVEGKFVDALRAVAAEMAMEELHEQRVNFVQKVQAAVSEDILKNGLELESVSLTGLDQTNKDYFNPNNAFDAEGLTKLTQEIEERRKKRNDIEQETEVLIRRKNLEAERESLEISRDQEYARLEQQREIQTRAAEQAAQIASEQAMRQRESEIAKITASQSTREADIEANRIVSERQIAMDKDVREKEIQKEQALEAAAVEKAKMVRLAEQERDIVVAEKSRAQSEAEAEADKARALAAKAAEEVITARQAEIADRDKRIELIEASKAAEMEAIAVTVAAEAEKKAATDRAEAVRIAAEAEAQRARIRAEGEAQAEKLRADAQERIYAVEAAGQRAVNEAMNVLSVDQIAMQIKLKLMDSLPQIIEQSVKPIENIDGIRILHVDGLGLGGRSGEGGATGAGEGGLSDQIVSSALRYRAQAPLVDAMLSEIGLKVGNPENLADVLTAQVGPAADSVGEEAGEAEH
jgi:uncharacterized membrane protein YqiK